MSDAVLKAWHPEPAPQAKSHSRLGQTGTLALALGLLGAALFAGAASLKGLSSAPPAPPVEASTPAPTWIDIIKPVRIFSLEAPELTNLPLAYSARRWSTGGREDVLAFGALGTDQPGLRLRIYRSDADTTMRRPLYAALALQAAEAGLSIGHSGLPDLLATRFGPFEITDVTLSGGADTAAVACSGFRLILDKPSFSVTGLACGGKHGLTRKRLGCLMDRLDIASGGEDRALIDFFAAAELKRDAACNGMRMGPDTVHAAWLDEKPNVTPRKSSRRH